MYCKNCGRVVDDDSVYCNNCGMQLDYHQKQTVSDDKPSFGFAVLGFFIPIVGLIIFLVYEKERPKRAKSAGKGALFRLIFTIILVIIYFVFFISLSANSRANMKSNTPAIGNTFSEEGSEETLEKYVDVTFGEFEISDNGYYTETSLEIAVKNKSDKQCTYYITIEAVDANGTRIETDTIYADKLNAGQDIYLTAFEYVEQERIDQLKNATFRVLEINKYDS